MADYVRVYTSTLVAKPTLGNPPSISVKAGATTGNSSTFTPGLTPGTGYVYFTCSTDAPKASCAITTADPLNHFVANSSAAESVTASVMTTANSVTPPLLFNPEIRIWVPVAIAGLLTLTLFALARRMRSRSWGFSWMLIAGLIFLGGVIAGCGGGASNVIPPPPPNTGTTPGAYTLTVYAFTESNASDGSNGNADASVSIPLNVN
jgi:hypothetical protein